MTLDITVDPTVDVSGFEIVFEVSSLSGTAYFDALSIEWDDDFDVLDHRFVDLTGFTPGTPPGTVRIAGMMIDGDDACLATGETVVAQVRFVTNNVCEGQVGIDGTTLSITKCNSCVIEAVTQFIECNYTIPMAATVEPGTVTVVNAAPVITAAIPDAIVHWGDTYSGQIVADDDDLHTNPGGYETLHYAKVMPGSPANLQVNATSGAITWVTAGADVGNNQVIVEVTDECGALDRDTFNVCVYNIAPVVICPDTVARFPLGGLATGSVMGYDPDGKPDSTYGGPYALEYFFVSLTKLTGDPVADLGTVYVDPATGHWSWPTAYEDTTWWGDYELCLGVRDNANVDACSPENADTCCLDLTVISPGTIKIAKTHNTPMGQSVWVDITMEHSSLSLGGFDFLIKYDKSVLQFLGAELGPALLNCGWEFFTYREGANGNCGAGACPTGIVRLVAMAETNNGGFHPDLGCFDALKMTKWVMARLQFYVPDDYNLECQYAPILWTWYDCGDNGLSDFTGDTLFIARNVYNYDSTLSDWSEEGWPTHDGTLDSCIHLFKVDPLFRVDYWHGGVDIICIDSLDDRGDINMNGTAYEVADAVVFCNYFVYGLGVFGEYQAGAVAATDVNADGLTLSVADLVYLIRIIVNDAIPYAPSGFVKLGSAVEVAYRHNAEGVLSMDGASIAAVALTVAGEVTPELLADGMQLLYASGEGRTRILVYSLEGHSFEGEFLRVEGEVLTLEGATAEGLGVLATELPTEFALHQNYPNPFNPITTVGFSLPTASDYTLSIYNVSGQKVASFSGHESAGKVALEWNASDLASGIYFYKLQAGSFTATKKMVLLK